MSIVSMTGFAEALGSREGTRWRWEAKSVNGRGLDVRLRTPPGFDGIEPVARTLANERFRRGSIQVQFTFESADAARGLKVDPVALAAAVRIAQEVASETGLAPARVDGLLALRGVIVQDEVLPIDAAERALRDAAIVQTLAAAFDALAQARAAEGQKLHTVLCAQLDDIERLTKDASALASASSRSRRSLLGQAPSRRLLAPHQHPASTRVPGARRRPHRKGHSDVDSLRVNGSSLPLKRR